jgi:tetratricopeptide (TPR) repeat protein
MKAQIAVLMTAAQVIATSAPVAAYNGRFPGKGNYHQWKKAVVLYTKGIKAEDAGKPDAAATLYEQAIELYPFDADFFLNLGLVYENDTQDMDKAEAAFKKGLELEPNDPELLLAWASFLSDNGNTRESIDTWRRAQRLLQEKADALETNKFKP